MIVADWSTQTIESGRELEQLIPIFVENLGVHVYISFTVSKMNAKMGSITRIRSDNVLLKL